MNGYTPRCLISLHAHGRCVLFFVWLGIVIFAETKEPSARMVSILFSGMQRLRGWYMGGSLK